jgi:hypothetical protein
MKRFTLAGTFASLAGAATLLLLFSIVYSCRMGGEPHESRYNSEHDRTPTNEAHTAVTTSNPQVTATPTELTIQPS